MSQFMLLIHVPVGHDADPAEHEQWMTYTKELRDAGVMVDGNALQPESTARAVSRRNGETLVVDGPFAETRELLGGYYVLDVEDEAAAIAWAERTPVTGIGTITVRPVVVYPDA